MEINHNDGKPVLTREDRISIQSAENTSEGFTWIGDNWLMCIAIVVVVVVTAIASGKVKL
jgi:hypothetical protein